MANECGSAVMGYNQPGATIQCEDNSIPFTGFDVGPLALAGIFLAVVGATIRLRLSTQ